VQKERIGVGIFEEPVIQVLARGLYVSGDRRCSVEDERRHDRSPSDFVVFNPEDKTVSIILIEVNSCATATESAEETAEPRNHWIDRLRSRFSQNDLGGDWLYRVAVFARKEVCDKLGRRFGLLANVRLTNLEDLWREKEPSRA
jgi:hypothetical protein